MILTTLVTSLAAAVFCRTDAAVGAAAEAAGGAWRGCRGCGGGGW